MNKDYNKKIPTEIHFIYGGRHSGKTYYEFNKIKDILDDYDRDITKLQEENNQYKEYIKELKDSLMNYHIKNNKLTSAMQDTYDTCGELQQRIDKAIEYIKSYNLPKDLGNLSECPISVGELKELEKFGFTYLDYNNTYIKDYKNDSDFHYKVLEGKLIYENN